MNALDLLRTVQSDVFIDETVLHYEIIIDESLINSDLQITNFDSIIESDSFSNIEIPISILSKNSSLEAIVVYLKDVCKLKFVSIGKILNRNERTIWVTYSNAKKKHVDFTVENLNSEIFIPSKIFSSRHFSVLETIVFYLKSTRNFSFNEMSIMLGKNYRTIWTVYQRVLKKMDKGVVIKNE